MERIAHQLKRNKATTRPQQMIFWDTETIPREEELGGKSQEFRLIVAHYWRRRADGKPDTHEWLVFDDVGAFWDWVFSKVRSHTLLYMVAHNLAFDALACKMLTVPTKRGWRCPFLHEDQTTRIVRWGYPTSEFAQWMADGKPICEYAGKRWAKSLVMMDNCNLFGGALERWGDSLGFPKLAMPAYDAPDSEWIPYCQRDVEIMVKLWEQWFAFLDEHDMGAFRMTLSSQAFSAFCHARMHDTIYIHTNERAIALERAAFAGGRTEAFYVGRRQGQAIYHLDVNSMYAHVMKANKYPTHLHATGAGMSLEQARKTLARYGMIARVKLDVTEPVFPIEQGARNIYPVGQFTTVLTTPEIVYALERGWITEIREWASYDMRWCFEWFVDYFYALKCEYSRTGDRLRRSLCKMILNGGYGKFGQAGYEDEVVGVAKDDAIAVDHRFDCQTRQWVTYYTVGGLVTKQTRGGEGYNSLVAIPAHVTANARLYLWWLIELAGRGHVLYCDTDSLFVDQVGYDALAHLVDDDRLGYLKLEGTAQSIEIRAPKDYIFGEKVVRKGIPHTAVDLGGNAYEYETWPSIRAHMEAGSVDTYHNRSARKVIRYEVDWADVGDDGWCTPYHVGITPLLF